MDLSRQHLYSFVKTNWSYVSGVALCTFGVSDLISAYTSKNLQTAHKAAYVARGCFYLIAAVFCLTKHASKIPFIIANVIGFGIHTKEFLDNTHDIYNETRSLLGMVSDIAYTIFTFVPHPAFISIAFLAGSVKVIMLFKF